MKINKYVYFAGTFFFLLLAYAFESNWLMLNSVSQEKAILKTIQKAVNEQIEVIQKQNAFAKTYLLTQPDIRFSTLNEEIEFPLFIYKNNHLVYWSDYKYVPGIDLLKGKYIYKFIKTDAGKFIAVKEKIKTGKDLYEIVSLQRLSFKYPFRNQYLKSGYNATLFSNDIQYANNFEAEHNVFSPDKTFLFSIDIQKDALQQGWQKTSKVTICIILAIVLFLIGLKSLLEKIRSLYGFDSAFLVLLVFALCIKLSLFFYNLQAGVPSANTFLSVIPDLTSIIINVLITLVCVGYIFRFVTHSKFIIKFISKAKKNYVLSYALLLFINALVLYGLYTFYVFIYTDTRLTPEVFYLTEFNYLKIIGLILALLLSAIYFMVTHLLARFWFRLHFPLKNIKALTVIGIYLLITLFAGILISIDIAVISVLALLYIYFVIKFDLPNTIARPRYVTYLYLFSCGILCSLTGAYAAFEGEMSKSENHLKVIAEKINREGDQIDLGMLYIISDSISKDHLIAENFSGPMSNNELAEQKIYKIYIGDAFDKFEASVYLFDSRGACVNKSIKSNYFTYLANYSKPRFSTVYKQIFQIKGYNPLFYSFVEVKDSNQTKGFVVLEFKLRKVVPNSVFPKLLLDGNFQNAVSKDNYSYAIFKNNELVSSYGNYNYFREYRQLSGDNILALSNGKTLNGNFHRLFTFQQDKSVIVSIPAYGLKRFFSNYSFLFLVQALLLAGFIFSNTFYYKLRQVSTTFTTKIQLFINFSFFVPLVVVSITTFLVISRSFESELQANFINKAEGISASLIQPLTDFNKRKISGDELKSGLDQVSKYVQSDINLYDIQGNLIVATQPQIFEASLLSSYINPKAFSSIVENREASGLIQESIGGLNYNTVYYSVKSYDTGELLGILAIPYFESNKDFQNKLADVFTTILNIFTAIFILFLGLTYFASRILTVPLALLTNKIKQTSLTKNNEPLVYKAGDEIGMLVKEYNRMLTKLDENKKALAASEKESAWREMAKQVAHEIKNPLTPMKLTLQNLQRIVKGKDERLPEITEKAIPSLLEQVDNLSEIASSFSAFTQMPIPKKEVFNISQLLERTLILYQNKENAKVESFIEPGVFLVSGDEKLMGRIFINLLANAFESVPEQKQALIKVSLSSNDKSKIIVAFSDNGEGILPELTDKVFQPNFSTKTSGSGIGLAVAKRGIEQMGGKIHFVSHSGEGTTFYINMPLS